VEKHYLDKLFNPDSIAVIGASDRVHSVGRLVFENIVNGKYQGKLFPVNLKHSQIRGQKAYSSIDKIGQNIDLAIITTPAQTVLKIIMQCGKKGVKAALIISAGFSETGEKGQELEKKIQQIAKQYGIRLIGPNCLGVIRPSLNLNATFDNNDALPGTIAFISQSGAIVASVLDWAFSKKIGFSTIVSLGNARDIDFGEILDFLALDKETNCILLYIEGIRNARQFMSGLRAASRMKPVIVVKGGRYTQGIRAAHSHTGALVGDDDVFDTALRRAGAVRVMTIEQLFSAVNVFANSKRTQGNKLAIITNGGGAGVLAADRAVELNLCFPKLSDKTFTALNRVLPQTWSHQNPIDIIGDATPERYHDVIKICSKDENIDGLLIILSPVAMTDPLSIAKQVIFDAKNNTKPMIFCWMGGHNVQSSKNLFTKHQIPYFETPEEAVEAFSFLAEYQRNQKLLQQVPTSSTFSSKPDISKANLILNTALAENRTLLTTIESKAILNAFGIATTNTVAADSAQAALKTAKAIQLPLVMKINSPDISHKQDVNGVKLGIVDLKTVSRLFNQMIADANHYQPKAKILGVTIEPMLQNPNNRELMIGVIQDKVFGPVISLGMGGSLVEIIHDRAIALPPLNSMIIKQLIARTRLAKLLGLFRNKAEINQTILIETLLKVSEMVCELPCIQEMDINPLIINDKEAVVVDARFIISNAKKSIIAYSHMAICPYPIHLISTWVLNDGTEVIIRPIRPEDAQLEQIFIHRLSAQSRYFRFMGQMQELSLNMLIRFTQIDYDREMALVATLKDGSTEVIIGITRYITNPDFQSCEFALVIADAWQGKGLGYHLMVKLIEVAKENHLKLMTGTIFSSNLKMLNLVKKLGFSIKVQKDDTQSKIASKLV
jgi:acetyltransferase